MNRFTFFLAVSLLFYLSATPAIAQHGHGAGGAMGNPGMHGGSGEHGDAAGSATGTSGSHSVMASTNPGSVLDHNSHLSSKLEGLLNLSGPNALATLKADASGFKNFGQFVAAVHVSHNLGIPFADLQAKMTGKGGVSLGKAIQSLRPTANSGAETKKATSEANEDVNETS